MLFLLLMAQLIVPAVSSAQPSGLRGRVIAAVQRYLNRYQANCFNRVARLGDIARFRRALNWATMEIDPAYVQRQNSQAVAVRGAIYGAALRMLADPGTMTPARLRAYERTLYHETIHLIEYQNGDSDGTRDWNERHAFYFEAMERNVLRRLVNLEQQARNRAIPLDRLRSEWNTAMNFFRRGAAGVNRTIPIPNDLNQFERWSGARVRMADVEQLYRSGACGPRLRDMFTPGTMLTGLTIQNLSIGGVPRTPSDRTTRYTGNVTFTAQGVTNAWNGTVDWLATVTGPRNFRQLFQGIYTVRGSGPHTRSYAFNLPLRVREGGYRLNFRVSSQRRSANRNENFNHSYLPMNVRINRPRSVLQGQPAEVKVELTRGTHNFWWEWSGGGTRGNGNSQRFVMRVPNARTPAVTFNLQVWDEGRNRDNPVTRTVTVPVRGQPTGPEIAVSLSYPRESAVDRRVTLAGNASGGLGTLRAQWTTPTGATVGGYRVQGNFRTAGVKTFILRVWDQGKYLTKPKQVVARIQVYPKLEARILGPNLIESGKRLQLSAEARGGKRNYRYRWILPDGQEVRQRSFSQIVRGRPGSERWYRLSVVDSLRPRQRVNLTKVIRIREKPQIVIRGVRVLPGTIAPGKNAVVRAQFSVRGFKGPQVPVLARIWMENSSGSNRGITRDRRIVVRPGQLSRVEARLLTHPRAKTGPIRATVQIWAGRLTQIGQAQAVIKVERPGGLQDVTVNRRAIRLLIRDHGTADGDRIAIILNNRVVSRDLTLTKRGHQFTLALRPGKNQLKIRAHNEGRQSPNTAEIKLTNVVRGKEKQKYRLKRGKEGFFFIVAP